MIRALFAAELRRLCGPLRIATALHAVGLALLAYSDALFAPTAARQVEASTVVAFAGLVLGIFQVGAYRRGGLWGYLLHRPLPPAAIFAAIAGAATVFVAVAIALPLAVAGAVATLAYPAGGAWRLLVAPYALALALTTWCAGAVVALRPWRGAALAAAPVALLLVPTRLGAWVFVPMALVFVGLGALALAAFRPDLSSPPRRWGAGIVAVAPALYVLFVASTFALLLAYSLGVAFLEAGWRGPARFAWNDYYAHGTIERAGYLPGRELVARSLGEGGAAAARYASRLAAAEVVDLVPEPGRPLEQRVDSIASTATATLLLADEELRVLPLGALTRPEALAPATARLPLGGAPSNLERVAVAVVGDELLVTLVEGRRSERGFAPARQSVWLLAADGRRERLAESPLAPGAPAWVRHRGFVVSPLLQTADDLVRSTFWGVGPRSARWREIVAHPPPPAIAGLAFGVTLAAALATALAARRRGLDAGARRGWTLAALLFGPPILFALPLFTVRRS